MTTPFPHLYKTTLRWSAGQDARLQSPPRADIAAGAPPEFDGKAEVWSPEHLLLSAAALCLMTTFQAIAARSKLELSSYDCSGEARLLEMAKKHCIVANSLKVPLELHLAGAAV